MPIFLQTSRLCVIRHSFKRPAELHDHDVFLFAAAPAGRHTLQPLFAEDDTRTTCTQLEESHQTNKKIKHDASVSDLLGPTMCLCLSGCCSFHNVINKKNAQMQRICFTPDHTLAELWHFLCGCKKIYCSVLSGRGSSHETADRICLNWVSESSHFRNLCSLLPVKQLQNKIFGKMV